MATTTLKPLQIRRYWIGIKGTSPLLQHKWSEKAKEQMRQKHAGRKTKDREKRDPEAEASAAMYLTESGECGIPVLALKSAIIGAAHKDIGVEKTLVRKSLFLPCDDENMVIPMEFDRSAVQEDHVRVGQSTDLRYRPVFHGWRCRVEIELDEENLTIDTVVNLINRAGFGVGIGEWRPEKGGSYGRFELDANAGISPSGGA